MESRNKRIYRTIIVFSLFAFIFASFPIEKWPETNKLIHDAFLLSVLEFIMLLFILLLFWGSLTRKELKIFSISIIFILLLFIYLIGPNLYEELFEGKEFETIFKIGKFNFLKGLLAYFLCTLLAGSYYLVLNNLYSSNLSQPNNSPNIINFSKSNYIVLKFRKEKEDLYETTIFDPFNYTIIGPEEIRYLDKDYYRILNNINEKVENILLEKRQYLEQLKEVKKLGAQLYNCFVKTIQKLPDFSKQKGMVFKVIFDLKEEKRKIKIPPPFELCYDTSFEKEQEVFNEMDKTLNAFLGLRYIISREPNKKKYRAKNKNSPIKMFILTSTLNQSSEELSKSIKEEALSIKKELIKNRKIEIIYEPNVQYNYEDILEKMNEVDIFHYIGYAVRNKKGDYGWILGGLENILTSSHLNNVNNPPLLIFANTCGMRNLEIDSEDKSCYKNIASIFINEGFPNYIGSFYKIPTDEGAKFAIEFYKNLLEGKPIGEAFLLTKQTFHKNCSPIWMAYVHYGDPLIKLFD